MVTCNHRSPRLGIQCEREPEHQGMHRRGEYAWHRDERTEYQRQTGCPLPDRLAPTPRHLEQARRAQQRQAYAERRRYERLPDFTPDWATPEGRALLPKKPPSAKGTV